VRTYRYSQLLHWRTGTQLAYAGQQAQIELDTQRREIQLTVWGSFPYTFFEILKNTLDLVLERFQGLQILREIGCNCSEQRHFHFYSYDSLIKQLATTQHAEVFCPESRRHIPVETLLYGIHPNTTAFTSPSLERQLQEIKQNLVPANELRGRFDQLNEQLKWLWYGHLRTWNVEQQKLKAPCPSLFVLRQDPGMPFNPKDWVSRSYRMQLLCQYPGGPHIMQGEEGYELREGKAWWKTMSPWLRHLVEVLKVGVPMSKALGEVFDKVDVDRFASDIDLLNEVLTDLPAIREIETIEEVGPNAQTLRQQRLEGAAFQALYSFLNKQKRPWQGLSQVLTPDGTILWLCDHHRKEYEFPPPVI
jgi:internalin A